MLSGGRSRPHGSGQRSLFELGDRVAKRADLGSQRLELGGLGLEGGDGEAGIAVEVDVVAIGGDGDPVRRVVDDEAQTRGGRSRILLVAPASEPDAVYRLAQRVRLGRAQVFDVSLEGPTRSRTNAGRFDALTLAGRDGDALTASLPRAAATIDTTDLVDTALEGGGRAHVHADLAVTVVVDAGAAAAIGQADPLAGGLVAHAARRRAAVIGIDAADLAVGAAGVDATHRGRALAADAFDADAAAATAGAQPRLLVALAARRRAGIGIVEIANLPGGAPPASASFGIRHFARLTVRHADAAVAVVVAGPAIRRAGA